MKLFTISGRYEFITTYLVISERELPKYPNISQLFRDAYVSKEEVINIYGYVDTIIAPMGRIEL